MTVKTSISISDQQAAYARQQVEEGRFSSISAVIQSALEAKRREDEEYAAWKRGFEAEMLRRMDGPFLNEEESQKQFDEMIRQERQRLGLES